MKGRQTAISRFLYLFFFFFLLTFPNQATAADQSINAIISFLLLADRSGSSIDSDADGFSLSKGDCNDLDSTIHPGANEVCGDGIDQDCSGADLSCDPSLPHANLLYKNYPDNCLSCHTKEAQEMSGSTHYKWLGDAPDMVNGTNIKQGKLTNAVNSYCTNITGDWQLCGKCHIGRGLRPDNAAAGLENIDCLTCHNEEYAKVRIRLSDGSMGVANPTDSMVQNIHKPTRTNCLKCHATAGGGDGVKRGDLSMATITNANPNFDVHMNTSGNNLACQACHQFKNHKTIGKGSDLRVTDDMTRGSEISCTTCHTAMATTGHTDTTIDRHAARGKIACQVCHIPTYAKVATETHRDWRQHEDGTDANRCDATTPCPGPPLIEKAADLIPEYKWWNRKSDNYLLGDDASRTFDAALSTYPTSRPLGIFDLNDTTTKIYPFKYKTAVQPKTVRGNNLIALDTFVYLSGTGNITEAIQSGLVDMGYPASEPIEWITTDTYQLLNHGAEPASSALTCTNCHSSNSGLSTNTRMPFAELGYHDFRNSSLNLCALCHSLKSANRVTMHDKHVRSEGYACNACHGSGAPLKKVKSDLCNDCHGSETATTQRIHTKHVTDRNYKCSTCHTF
ncbi:MAG: MopE-related protein [Desulfocapsaceae bacterium]|nr:MopE-related protein [Desulfocapsaceae bacterium]